MADFRVAIGLLDDTQVVYTAANGRPYQSEIVLDELTKELVERFNYWVGNEDTQYERPDLELLGRILYHILFPTGDASGRPTENLRELFEADYAQFFEQAKGEDRFHLTLELHEGANVLAGYPWEFLFIRLKDATRNERAADRGFFLAGERNRLILTRFVPTVPQSITWGKTEEPLRILVVFSHPKELPNIDSRATREVIASITKLQELEDVEVRVEEDKTHTELYTLMNGADEPRDSGREPKDRIRFKPDIFHFIGHGKANELALKRTLEAIQADEDEGRPGLDAAWCDSRQVLALFANHTPRLVFLHACESAQRGSVESFSNLARNLVYSQVPSVVAMQYTITNKDAALFAKTFYEEIRKGSRIDEAVRAGREALGQAQDKKKSFADRRFGTPVVYLQKDSWRPLIGARLNQRQQSTTRPTSTVGTEGTASSPAVERRECPRCHGQAYEFCTVCGLRFRCKCGHLYPDPLGKFCGLCPERIVQAEYTPEPVSSAVGEAKGLSPAVPRTSSSFDEGTDRAKLAELFPQGTTAPSQTM